MLPLALPQPHDCSVCLNGMPVSVDKAVQVVLNMCFEIADETRQLKRWP